MASYHVSKLQGFCTNNTSASLIQQISAVYQYNQIPNRCSGRTNYAWRGQDLHQLMPHVDHQRRVAEWIVRRCATLQAGAQEVVGQEQAFLASYHAAAVGGGVKPRLNPIRWRSWRGSRTVLTREMVSQAGFFSASKSARLSGRWAFGGFAPSTPQGRPANPMVLKNLAALVAEILPDRAIRKAFGDMVPGRGKGWSTRDADPHPGKARDTPARPSRYALQMELYLRGGLSGTRNSRRADLAMRQYRSDGIAPRRDRQNRGHRRACPVDRGWTGMA